MRFKTSVKNIQTFNKLTASLSSIGKVAWVRLNNDNVHFTIIPETGSQVWAALSIESIFDDYTIQSNMEDNTINLELPLPPLQRALKSAMSASSASLRLTKKDSIPILSLTIVTNTQSAATGAAGFLSNQQRAQSAADPFASTGEETYIEEQLAPLERETIITQDIPIRILTASSVEGIHEPHVREPEIHILLPPLMQLKAISDRFTKLALATASGSGGGAGSLSGMSGNVPKLVLKANMHGTLKMSIETDTLNIESVWTDLVNPELDPVQIDGRIEDHPTSRMRDRGPDAFATVRIDGKDWGRVLSVGRLGGRVVACL